MSDRFGWQQSTSVDPSRIHTPPVIKLSLRDRVFEIISRGLSSSKEKEALLELAEGTKKRPEQVEDLARLLRNEAEVEEGRASPPSRQRALKVISYQFVICNYQKRQRAALLEAAMYGSCPLPTTERSKGIKPRTYLRFGGCQLGGLPPSISVMPLKCIHIYILM